MTIHWIVFSFTAIFVLSMLGGGLALWKFPPKDINAIVGYRTKRSQKSQEAWDFAQRYAGKVWVICGILDGVVGIPLSFLPFPQEEWVPLLFLLLQAAVLFLVCPLTERALHHRFD